MRAEADVHHQDPLGRRLEPVEDHGLPDTDVVTIQIDTRDFAWVHEWFARRRSHGQDTYDEWWEGVYRIVTGPTLEHGQLIWKLIMFLDPLVRHADLIMAPPINIGVNKQDARVPDIGIVEPDTPRTSPAFLTTAVMVIEILSPNEKAGEKLPFYAKWDVQEYLEISLTDGTVRLLKRDGNDWQPALASQLGFTVTEDELHYPNGPAHAGARLDVKDYQIGGAGSGVG